MIFISDYGRDNYDCIIAQDVLEYVKNPIEMAYQISNHVKENGYVIFANCFYPVIKCHLPSTFYLRHTFKFIMQSMGLTYCGGVLGAEHALVFQKTKYLNLEKSLRFAKRLKSIGLFFNKLQPIASKVKYLLK